ncbi:MAG TPA: hypothetical protein VMB49_03470 [Acidobacteriaceae bacterium]|nr:hypothetical protein [Acidobacteriaceae bacterium]
MSVYADVVNVSKAFLGPATEKFLERQCRYLKVNPDALTKADLKQLAWLSKNAAGSIMDAAQAEKLAQKIEAA